MRRFSTLVTLALVCSLFTATSDALAGNHKHSGGQKNFAQNNALFAPQLTSNDNSGNRHRQPKQSQTPQVITGTSGGVGYIADPAPRIRKSDRHVKTENNFIVDPVGPKPNSGQFAAGAWTQATVVAIPDAPTRVTPVVRDHTIVKDVPVTPTRSRGDAIYGEGLGILPPGQILQGLNPFGAGFTAPEQRPQIVDHRTQTVYPGSGRTGGKRDGSFTPSTTGPANSTP